VATVLAVGRGPNLFLVGESTAEVPGVAWGPDLQSGSDRRIDLRPEDLPERLVQRIRPLPSEVRLFGAGVRLTAALAERIGRPVEVSGVADLRRARSKLKGWAGDIDREFVLRVARGSLERALRSPEEVLISLAREEERLERAIGREARAAEAFLAPQGSPLEEYARLWREARAGLEAHHAGLVGRLERESQRLLPNLSATVGPRVAARLLSAAGSLAGLGRMNGSRLQLLGTRRRPSAERGPRYGVVYRASRMEDVPAARRGAYARTLASLAAIAARADATTRRDLSGVLVSRRDRRVADLRRQRR
jgi:hypothetical protein